jgi:hypothetical protein
MRRTALAWVPAVAWAALIFIASAQPDLRFVPDATLDLVVRKVGHMAVFGILALLLWRALATTTTVRRPGAWALLLAILYAITDEAHQAFVTGRHASPVDVAIDAAGVLIAIGVVAGVMHVRRMRQQARRTQALGDRWPGRRIDRALSRRRRGAPGRRAPRRNGGSPQPAGQR